GDGRTDVVDRTGEFTLDLGVARAVRKRADTRRRCLSEKTGRGGERENVVAAPRSGHTSAPAGRLDGPCLTADQGNSRRGGIDEILRRDHQGHLLRLLDSVKPDRAIWERTETTPAFVGGATVFGRDSRLSEDFSHSSLAVGLVVPRRPPARTESEHVVGVLVQLGGSD